MKIPTGFQTTLGLRSFTALCALCASLSVGCSGTLDSGDDEPWVDSSEEFSGYVEQTPASPATVFSMSPQQRQPYPKTQKPSPGMVAPPPPPPPPTVRALDVTILTGNDDLRGGIYAYFKAFLDNGAQPWVDINAGATLAGNSLRTFRLQLPAGVAAEWLGGFEICGSMTGGVFGDNWNIDAITILTVSEAGGQIIFNAYNNTPWFVPLTGDQPCAYFSF